MKFYIPKSLKGPSYRNTYIMCFVFISFSQEIMQIVGSDVIAECLQLCSHLPKIFKNIHRKKATSVTLNGLRFQQ